MHYYPDTLTGVSPQVSMTTQLEGVDGEWAAADDVTPQRLTKPKLENVQVEFKDCRQMEGLYELD